MLPQLVQSPVGIFSCISLTATATGRFWFLNWLNALVWVLFSGFWRSAIHKCEKKSVWIEYDVNSLSYDYDGGQGSGSQGTATLSGKVKSVTSDKVFISIDDAKLNKYTKKYQVMYKRDGKGISKRDITKITTL